MAKSKRRYKRGKNAKKLQLHLPLAGRALTAEDAPKDLAERELELWREFTTEMGLKLSTADRVALRHTVKILALFEQDLDALEPDVPRIFRNAPVAKGYLRELGATPASRLQMKIKTPDDQDDPKARFFNKEDSA